MITREYLYSTICISCNSEHFLLSDSVTEQQCILRDIRWDWYIVTSITQCFLVSMKQFSAGQKIKLEKLTGFKS